MKKACIIIQARVTSTRLPNKIFHKINDKPVIEFIVEECLSVKDTETVLAVPYTQHVFFNDMIKKYNIKVIEGDENDVLSRYYSVAEQLRCDIVVRVSSDCVLITHDIIEKTLDYYNKHYYDYVINTSLDSSYKDTKNDDIVYRTDTLMCDGFDVEVFSFDALQKAYTNASTPSEKEHMTIWMKENLRCSVYNDMFMYVHGKFSLDCKDDLEAIEAFLLLHNKGFIKLGDFSEKYR